jgi:hypothetical protein
MGRESPFDKDEWASDDKDDDDFDWDDKGGD